MSCKAKDCYMYKSCLAKYDLVGEHHCDDYKRVTSVPACKHCLNYFACSDEDKGASICGAYETRC